VIKLIVGLGNPGKKYQRTRHNVGFLLLDELARSEGIDFTLQSRFFGSLAEVVTEKGKIYLLKPNTFMNRSGQSVSSVMKYFKITSEEILVIHDELDFSVGSMKLKFSGGHGGHNGLRDIISALDTKDFVRLRLGIDRPSSSSLVADYVLSDFPKADVKNIEMLFFDFISRLPALYKEGYESLMQEINIKK